jgi:hypothetical protein
MPALAGNRGMLRWLDGLLQGRADNQWVTVLRSLPGGRAEVKKACHEESFIVGVSPGISFAPGTQALAASNSGTHGDLIIGTAPGRSGGSAYAQAETRRSGIYNIRTPSTCPAIITSKSYLAVYLDTTTEPDRLYGFRYQDGAYVSTVGFAEIPSGVVVPSFSGNPLQRVHPLGDVVILKGLKSGEVVLLTFSPAAGTIKVAETHIDSGDVGGPVWPGSGSHMYFADIAYFGGAQHVQLYKCAIGFEGDIDLPTATVGDEYVEGTGDLTLPGVLYASGVDFQIPGFYPGGDGIAVPFSSGGAWQLGDSREILSPTFNVSGYGYPCSGNRIIRGTNFENGNETVGLLPAGPNSPEISLFPPEWNLSSVGHLAVNPAKNQVSCFPVEIIGEPGTGDRLLRVQIQSTAFGAACPVPFLTVEPATPTGQLPAAMLARD